MWSWPFSYTLASGEINKARRLCNPTHLICSRRHSRRRSLNRIQQARGLALGFYTQFLEHKAVSAGEAIRVCDRLKLLLAFDAFFKVAFDFDVVLDAQPLLDAVDVQHDHGAERVVLCEPEGAEQIRRGEHVVYHAYNGHGGFEACGDVGRRVVSGVWVGAPVWVRGHVS